MVAELICEAAFSYFGFFTCKRWKKDKVGEEYLAYVESRRNNNESIADGVK